MPLGPTIGPRAPAQLVRGASLKQILQYAADGPGRKVTWLFPTRRVAALFSGNHGAPFGIGAGR